VSEDYIEPTLPNEPAGFYSHYKNPDKLYYVIGCCTNRTTGRREVVYLALYDSDQALHTRHVDEFLSTVSDLSYVQRFSKASRIGATSVDQALDRFKTMLDGLEDAACGSEGVWES
jgi:hypothetical protein